MSLQNFIKTYWESAIDQSLRKTLVASAVSNTQYSGTLKQLGDKVKVIQVSDPTITAYTRMAAISYEQLDDAAMQLEIDKAYTFSFKTDDVDAVQEKQSLLTQHTDKAAYGFADTVDTALLAMYAQSGITSYQTGTTNWDINSLNVFEVIADAKTKAKKANWPEQGRYMIIPPWLEEKIIISGITTKTQNDELLTNGAIGRILGWDLYVSNNVSIGTAATGANTRIMAGIKGETTAFAGVINNVEALRLEGYMADAVRGLYVFGVKTMRP
ncbi:MAG: hypothetical protein IMZ53_05375, partial [Thermoplasmata archaeon]|nr:hypothetical protein [Thermoplasmata archaeon]